MRLLIWRVSRQERSSSFHFISPAIFCRISLSNNCSRDSAHFSNAQKSRITNSLSTANAEKGERRTRDESILGGVCAIKCLFLHASTCAGEIIWGTKMSVERTQWKWKSLHAPLPLILDLCNESCRVKLDWQARIFTKNGYLQLYCQFLAENSPGDIIFASKIERNDIFFTLQKTTEYIFQEDSFVGKIFEKWILKNEKKIIFIIIVRNFRNDFQTSLYQSNKIWKPQASLLFRC